MWRHPREKEYLHRIELKRNHSRSRVSTAQGPMIETALANLNRAQTSDGQVKRSFKVAAMRAPNPFNSTTRTPNLMKPTTAPAPSVEDSRKQVYDLLRRWDSYEKKAGAPPPAVATNVDTPVQSKVTVSAHTVELFAEFLGVDIYRERELLSVAENALRSLPPGYELGIGDGDDTLFMPYFVNTSTGETSWHHPRESILRKKIQSEQRRKYLLEHDDDHQPGLTRKR